LIREHYQILKPIMDFFKKGDKELGIQQLRTVATNAFYTRTEAQYYLMRILAYEEQDMLGALQIAEYLNKTFPDNAYFHRFYARMLYSTGQIRKTERESLRILERIDSAKTGYEEISGRYAAFYLGGIYKQRNEIEKAKYYYQRAIQFAEAIDATDSGYYLNSMVSLGEIAMYEGDKDSAEFYLKRAKKNSKRKDPSNKRAKKLLKEL
jgi:tetratricopeptide (TPR) repeat protein